MAKIRLVAARPRKVPVLRGRVVQPDEVVEVPDKLYGAFIGQAENWQPVQDPKPAGEDPAAAKAKTAPRRTRDGE